MRLSGLSLSLSLSLWLPTLPVTLQHTYAQLGTTALTTTIKLFHFPPCSTYANFTFSHWHNIPDSATKKACNPRTSTPCATTAFFFSSKQWPARRNRMRASSYGDTQSPGEREGAREVRGVVVLGHLASKIHYISSSDSTHDPTTVSKLTHTERLRNSLSKSCLYVNLQDILLNGMDCCHFFSNSLLAR